LHSKNIKKKIKNKKMALVSKVRVLFHYPCPDGSFASYAAFKRFQTEGNLDFKLIPHSTFNPLAAKYHTMLDSDSVVYLLDYVGPQNFAVDLSKKVKKLIIIDHHKTAFEMFENKKDLPLNMEVNLEMKQSGATLAYSYFNKQKTLFPDSTTRE
jgi:hypothetical protein